jgi:hypothetical protein
MIRCLLVQISRNQRGQVTRKERRISGDAISIGRASECKVHLLDHRVSLHHALIRLEDDDKLHIEAEGGAININDEFVQNVVLAPGQRILVGPYALVVEALSGNQELTLSCERVVAAGDRIAAELPTTLSAAGLSTRKFALWLAFVIASCSCSCRLRTRCFLPSPNGRRTCRWRSRNRGTRDKCLRGIARSA